MPEAPNLEEAISELTSGRELSEARIGEYETLHALIEAELGLTPEERGYVHRLDALSPVDGRYGKRLVELGEIFSERGLMQARVVMSVEYLLALSEHPDVPLRTFTKDERAELEALKEVSLDDAGIIKAIETKGFGDIKGTNHDVKAVEYYLKHRLRDSTLNDCLEWIRFGLTSADDNNIALAMMVRRAVNQVVLPDAGDLRNDIEFWATYYHKLPMLARTHGQPASPTTFGKEMRVFVDRLSAQIEGLQDHQYKVKLNGASGNYDAHRAALPDVDWPQFTVDFINRFNGPGERGFEPNLVTTQIEPHDTYAELFQRIHRLNSVIVDFDQDMWRYISDEWVGQKAKAGEVGSSAMPHKVNPIDFENGEGNAAIAQALCDLFARKLPVSRLQRDLSDSTVERNFGVAFGHTVLAVTSSRRGLSKCVVNEVRMAEALKAHPEVVTEAYNAILRAYGYERPYEQLSLLARGKVVTMAELARFVWELDVPLEVKSRLDYFLPENYTGYAADLARGAADDYSKS